MPNTNDEQHGPIHEPGCIGRALLRALTVVVDAVPSGQPPHANPNPNPNASPNNDGSMYARRAQHLGCRFLLSLFVMDALGWGAYKLIAFEAIRAASAAYSLDPDGFGVSPVIFVR